MPRPHASGWAEEHPPTRLRHEPELVGAYEAARLLGVEQTNLRSLRGLPDPYQYLASTTLWRRVDIEVFADIRNERRQATRARKETV